MNNLLLDSNALISYVTAATRIGKKSRELFKRANLFYSTISLFELKLKELRIPGFISPLSESKLNQLGINKISFDSEDLRGLVQLATKDPFDVMLVAQAKARNLGFVTADLAILDSNLDFVLDITD